MMMASNAMLHASLKPLVLAGIYKPRLDIFDKIFGTSLAWTSPEAAIRRQLARVALASRRRTYEIVPRSKRGVWARSQADRCGIECMNKFASLRVYSDVARRYDVRAKHSRCSKKMRSPRVFYCRQCESWSQSKCSEEHLPSNCKPRRSVVVILKSGRGRVDGLTLCNRLRLLMRPLGEALRHYNEVSTVVHEMMEPEVQSNPIGISAEVEHKQSGSSCVTVQPVPSVVLPPKPVVDSSTYIAKEPVDFKGLIDRWAYLTDFEWSSVDSKGDIKANINIFKDLYKALEDQPIRHLIDSYQYGRISIELLIQVSTTQFHTGQLIAAIYYGATESQTQKDGQFVDLAVQRPHAILKAGAGCEASITVPYVYPLSMMPLSKNEFLDAMNYAMLWIRVLNPLVQGSESTSVMGTIQFKITDIEFSGIRPTRAMSLQADDHEMLPELFNMVSNLSVAAKSLLGKDCDHPPAKPQRSGMVPQLMQNPSCVIGPEVINEMRLVNNTLTPHFESTEEFNISTWVRTFGLLDTIKWSHQAKKGELLTSLPVQPVSHSNSYTKLVDQAILKPAAYSIPPVAQAASMATYYRGSMEYKFDVICSSYHSGRLLVAFLPGYVPPTFSPTLADLRSMVHCTVDVSKEKCFSFVAPYIAPQVAYPTALYKTNETTKVVPYVGTVYVVVLTKLALMSSVSNTVQINIYVRGGEDFELFIPKGPDFIAHDDAYNSSAITMTSAKQGYYPMYPGTWHLLTDNVLIYRYGQGSDHIAQFEKCAYPGIYEFGLKHNNIVPAYQYPAAGIQYDTCTFNKYCICVNDAGNYYYMVPIPTEWAEKEGSTGKIDELMKPYWGNFSKTVAQIDQLFKTYRIVYKHTDYTAMMTPADDKCTMAKVVYALEHQVGEENRIYSPLQNELGLVKPLGDMHFGEPPLNLKNCTKRYQFYANLTGAKVSNLLQVAYFMPVLPGGLDFHKTDGIWIADQLNRFISTPYLYFKGSMNFKIICVTPGITFWVQHLQQTNLRTPNFVAVDKSAEIPNKTPLTQLASGYAYIMQNSSVNNCIEVAVPYYRACDKIYVRPNFSADDFGSEYIQQFMSLGTLAIGTSDTKAQFLVLYAFGDDANFSTFIGFPCTSYVSSVRPIKSAVPVAEHEMMNSIVTKVMASPTVEQVVTDVKDVVSEVSQSVSSLTAQSAQTLSRVDRITDAAQQVMEQASLLFDKIKVTAASSFSWFSGTMLQVYNVIVSNVMHYVVNPSKSCLSISIVAILIAIGILEASALQKACNIMNDIMASCVCINVPQMTEVITNLAPDAIQHESVDPVVNIETVAPELAGLLFTSVCRLSGVALKPPKSLKEAAIKAFSDVGSFSKDSLSIMTMMRRIWKLLEYMYNYIFSISTPMLTYIDKLPQENLGLLAFIKEVNYLTDAKMRDKIYSSPNLVRRIEICKAVGDDFKLYIVSKLHGNTTVKHEFQPHLELAIKKITELYNTIVESHAQNHHRIAPYCVWMWGKPGIGKTQTRDSLIPTILDGLPGVNASGVLYHTVGKTRYWNNFMGQKAIYYDDFGNNQNTDFWNEIVPYFQDLLSTAPFNVPMAAVEDKKMLAAPYLVLVNSNLASVQHATITDPGAFERRRTAVVQARVNGAYEKYYVDHCFQFSQYFADHPERQAIVNGHLVFDCKFRYNFKGTSQNHTSISYQDLLRVLKENFVKYYNHEEKLRQEAMLNMVTVEDSPLESLYAMMRSSKLRLASELFKESTLEEVFATEMVPVHELDDEDVMAMMDDEILKEFDCMPTAGTSCNHRDVSLMDMRKATYFPLTELDVDKFAVVHKNLSTTIFNASPCAAAGCPWREKRVYYTHMLEWYRVQIDPVVVPDILQNIHSKRNTLTARLKSSVTSFCSVLKKFALSTIPSALRKTFELIQKWGKVIGLMAAGVGTIGLVTLAYKKGTTIENKISSFTSKFDEPREHQGYGAHAGRESGDAGTRVIRLKSNNSVVRAAQRRQVEHNITASNTCNITDNLRRNTVFLECSYTVNGVTRRLSARCFVPCGRLLVGVQHYFESIDRVIATADTWTVLVKSYYGKANNAVGNYVKLDWKNIIKYVYPGTNLFSLDLPMNFNPRRDMTNSVATSAQHSLPYNEGFLIIISEKDEILKERVVFKQTACTIPASDMGSAQELEITYNYRPHQKGMCGSLLVVNNFVCGMHVAGSAAAGGFAVPLVRESFKSMPTKSTEEPIMPTLTPIGINDVIPLNTNLFPEGYVPKSMAHHQASKTQIVPSKLNSVITPSVMCPAPLVPCDEYGGESPLYDGCNKHGHPPLDFDDKVLDVIEEAYTQLLIKSALPLRRSVGKLSIEDSIVGFPGLAGYDRINMSTSEGYPYKNMRPPNAVNKSWLFKFDENEKLTWVHPQLMGDMAMKDSMRCGGVVPFTVFIDSLKDTKIKRSKLNKPGCTRIFSLSPIDFTIQCRQVTLDFSAAYTAARFNIGSGVGINKFSLEWTQLVKYLLSVPMKGNEVPFVAGDYSGFGDSLPYNIVRRCFNIIQAWYEHYGDDDEENMMRRRIIGEEIAHSRHLVKDFVYTVMCGAPSGSPLTVILNDMVNEFFIASAWLKTVPIQYATMGEFYRLTRRVKYGDDLLIAISDEVIEFYNMNTMSQYFAKFNIKFTDASKTSDGYADYLPLDKVSFLKSEFYPHPIFKNVWLPRLELVSITESWQWFREIPTEDIAVSTIIDSALQNLWGWGPVIYEEYRQKLLRAWLNEPSYSIPLITQSWEYWDSLFLSDLYVDIM